MPESHPILIHSSMLALAAICTPRAQECTRIDQSDL